MQFLNKVKLRKHISQKLVFNFGVLAVFSSFLLVASCSRLPDIQGKGETFLQGVWNQDSIANSAQLQNYTRHHFKFTCDSFYVDFTTHSKVNYYEEECFNNGIWKEYAKGVYQVRNDTLILVGDFTKPNYKQKVSGCYRNGRYISSFKVSSWNTEELKIENLSDQTEVNLKLKEKITCVQKAL